jgi:putative ABC transport system substrate-binding protein
MPISTQWASSRNRLSITEHGRQVKPLDGTYQISTRALQSLRLPLLNCWGLLLKRRDFMTLVAGLAAGVPLASHAQRAPKRLAIFNPSEANAVLRPETDQRYFKAFFDELRRLGYVENQNLIVEPYGREQNTSGPETLAADIVRGKPDIVYAIGPGSALFKNLTTTIPIVVLTGDPIALGMADSLSHPGRNFTGASVDTGPSIHGKRMELLREISPALSKLGCLLLQIQLDGVAGPAIRATAERIGLPIAVSLLEFGASEADYRRALDSLSGQGANGLMVVDSPETFRNSRLIARLAAEARLPSIGAFREYVEGGGLMAYSFDLTDLSKRCASDVDQIFKGATPGNIPFYQPSKFELSVNLATASRLGLAVSASLAASVDWIVE